MQDFKSSKNKKSSFIKIADVIDFLILEFNKTPAKDRPENN